MSDVMPDIDEAIDPLTEYAQRIVALEVEKDQANERELDHRRETGLLRAEMQSIHTSLQTLQQAIAGLHISLSSATPPTAPTTKPIPTSTSHSHSQDEDGDTLVKTSGTRAKPSTPADFDGDRAKGRAFLTSCRLYILLRPDLFQDERSRVMWALSFFKSGRAAVFAERLLRVPFNSDTWQYNYWERFEADFIREFCPVNEAADAITRLESVTYHQGSRALEDYIDEFESLIALSGYTDGLTKVIKFRRGLVNRVQNSIAEMPNGRPADNDLDGWFTAARRIDNNRAANDAFRSASLAPKGSTPAGKPFNFPPSFNTIPKSFTTAAPASATPAQPRPVYAHTRPAPGAPVPMDVDANRRQRFHTIRQMATDEREALLEKLLAEKDAEAAEMRALPEDSEDEAATGFPVGEL
jgi:hypothetical protein